MKTLLHAVALLASTNLAFSAIWGTDFEAAKSLAKSEGKPILIKFTGSDWCSSCIRLEREVITQGAFENYAMENFVLMEVDFPLKQLPDDLKAQNAQLAKDFAIRGYPTVLLLDGDGTQLFEVPVYRGDGAEHYVNQLNELLHGPSEPSDPPGFYTWATANGLGPANRGPFLDPDQDGIPNWREYLLGLNPLATEPPPFPDQILVSPADMKLREITIRFRVSPTADILNEFEVEASDDFGLADEWSPAKAGFTGAAAASDPHYFIAYRFHRSQSGAPQAFFRIRYKGLTAHPAD